VRARGTQSRSHVDRARRRGDRIPRWAPTTIRQAVRVARALARIRAVLRRTHMLPPNLQPVHHAAELAFGDWVLDTRARHLVDAQGTLVSLTGGEYRLLRVLLDHPHRVLTRDQLLNLTQGRDADAFDRSIDLLVSRLRQRLRDDAREPRYIKTVRSEGYVFCADVSPRIAPA
jgi:two-component system OmpR family response regulator